MAEKVFRRVIQIDEDKCDGCGQWAEACHEGAIQIIEGKAKLVSDSYCDGLGDCIGECPQEAISFIEREAEPYDEEAVKENMGSKKEQETLPCGCPGTMARSLEGILETHCDASSKPQLRSEEAVSSELANWPVQLRLVPENAPYLKGADILLAADCSAAASPDFHGRFVRGRILLMGCPKLDDADYYREKLARIIRVNDSPSITVVRMEVPCCGGLAQLAEGAIDEARVDVELRTVILDARGKLVEDETVKFRFQ